MGEMDRDRETDVTVKLPEGSKMWGRGRRKRGLEKKEESSEAPQEP